MKKITELKSRSLRRERNSDVLRRMKNGEQLSSYSSSSSWYPPRPIIQKDINALQSLYGDDVVSLDQLSEHAQIELHPVRLA